MSHKNRLALNAVSPATIDDGRILIGDSFDVLAEYNDELTTQLGPHNLLQNTIGIGNRFLYTVSEFHDCGRSECNTCEFSESGIGVLVKKGRNIFLQRESAKYIWDGIVAKLVQPDNFANFTNRDGHYLLVSAYVPQDYREAYFDNNSVLVAHEAQAPTPLTIDDNAVLGRIDDIVQSVDASELIRLIGPQNIGLALESLTRMLGLQTSYLDLEADDAKVSAPVVHCKPVYTTSKKPPKPVRGSIIYNLTENCFEGYDGKKWRKLSWGDE